jgi:hypothetical protein
MGIQIMGEMSALPICVSEAHLKIEGALNTFCGSKTIIIPCWQHLSKKKKKKKKISRASPQIMEPSTMEF